MADADLLSYIVIPGSHSEVASLVYARDNQWVAPDNQRDELLNVVSKNLRGNKISFEAGKNALDEAALIVTYQQHAPSELELLDLSVKLRATTYDSAYVWLARHLNVRLVTRDKDLLQCAPDVAVSIEDFASGK